MNPADLLRKRLLYQSHHRGMREIDFVLGSFALKYIYSMTFEELKEFESLLSFSDQDIYGWVFKKIPIAKPELQTLLIKIQSSL